MELITLLLLSVLTLIIYYIFYANPRPKNFPPGPPGVPIFGCAFQLGRQSYIEVLKLREKYGNIIGVKMGSLWIVYLNDAEDIRELMSKPELQGKYHYNGLLDQAYGNINLGVMVSEGKNWVEQRRFCLRSLRDFGFGKKSMESIILDETNQLIQEFKATANKPISTDHAFNSTVLNVLWSIVAGERYTHNDPRLGELLKLLMEFMATLLDGVKGLYFIFPSLVKFRDTFPFLFSKSSDQFRIKLFAFFRKTIQEHRETLEAGNPRDFIDTYLEEQQKIEDPTSSFYDKDKDDFALTVLLMDLFIGGAETTSTTLSWSFFLLALHSEAQEKLYEEIQSVVGNRSVSLTDRPSLPYVEATILEIMRVSTLAPLGSPHSTFTQVDFKGYTIPKNTIILPNLYSVHYREDTWGDPEKFRPERFLSSDEKSVVKNKNLMPFLVGKRVCLGESLARDEIFLFLANLCQQFKVQIPEGEPEHTLKFSIGVMPHPEPHQIILQERSF